MRLIVACLTFLILASFPWDAAMASERDLLPGRTLMTFCRGDYDTDQGLCNGYVMAIADSMAGRHRVYGAQACGHEGIKAQELVDVRTEIIAQPALKDQPAGPMIASILSNAFPCFGDYEPAAGGTLLPEE